MKKLFKLCVLLMGFVFGLSACQDDYDDTAIRQDIENIQSEIEAIKADLATLKGQVNSIQTLVDAHKDGKVVTQIEELTDGNGYKITFNDATSITVLKYTGVTKGSALGVQELEGTYYWTVVTDGHADLLLDDKGEKVPVSGATVKLSLDELGYWTLDGKRIVDANEDFIRFKKGDSSALFKDIVVADDKITFILADDSEIVVNKKTETFLRFKESFKLLRKNLAGKLYFELSSDIQTLDIIKQPENWDVHVHRTDKYVSALAPSDVKFGFGEIRLQGIDRNGMIYIAIIKVGIEGKGFDNENGVFILNEGNMTTENGSLIYIDADGKIYDHIYESLNGTQLGNVTQDLYIDKANKKMYIMSQNGRINAVGTSFENDGMLVVANSGTLKKVAAYNDELATLSWPTHIAVLDDENIFIRDNNGVHRFNSISKELKLLEGSSGANKMRMAVAGGKVFAIQGNKLLMLEKGMSSVSKSLDLGGTINGVVKSEDDNLFVSMPGTPMKIVKVDSKTCEVIKQNEITDPKQTGGWGGTLGITVKGNLVYYYADAKIFCHDFEKATTKLMVNPQDVLPSKGSAYNNIAVHPLTGKVYLNTIKGYGFAYLTNNISVFKPEGDALVLEENYENYTRFPAGIFFPASF